VIQGSFIAEHANATFQSDEIVYSYTTALVQLLRAIAEKTKKLIGGNVSGVNLFKEAAASLLIKALDVFLQEDYYHTSIGLTGFFGLQKTWNTAVYAAMAK
jgi:hypothetical protein